jgi:hypothetical protein
MTQYPNQDQANRNNHVNDNDNDKNERWDKAIAPDGDPKKLPPWEWCVALLPFRIQYVGTGTTYHYSDFALETGQPVPMTNDGSETHRKEFYEAMLEIDWLAPKIRNAVMRELGRSQRAEDADYERGRNLVFRVLINERKDLMRKNNERPRGGVHEAAIEQVAREHGMTGAALKGRLRKKRLHR